MIFRRFIAFLLLCTFSFQQVTFASGGLVTGILEVAQHFSPEGAPAGFEIYLDEGLREEIVLHRNDRALQYNKPYHFQKCRVELKSSHFWVVSKTLGAERFLSAG